MSQEGPILSQMMIRYPFTPSSRRFFGKLSIEESFSSAEVLRQAENRLLGAIKRQRYERHISELIEFSSFFVSALIASQDQFLGQKFSEMESGMARDFFASEKTQNKPAILRECFDVKIMPSDVPSYTYSIPVVDFLRGTTKFEMRSQQWKLVNRPLDKGIVYLSENDANDFFGDLSEKMIYGGVKNLRKATFPKQLEGIRERIIPYLPPQKVRSTRGYLYIEELLGHPVSDGRHRLTWLVLAPYLVNVKNLEENDAVDRIRAFVAARGETSSMKRFIEYNVKRAKRNGLMPPTLVKLRSEHPDVYALLPKEIVQKYRSAAGN
jgi:hypothetical protein